MRKNHQFHEECGIRKRGTKLERSGKLREFDKNINEYKLCLVFSLGSGNNPRSFLVSGPSKIEINC